MKPFWESVLKVIATIWYVGMLSVTVALCLLIWQESAYWTSLALTLLLINNLMDYFTRQIDNHTKRMQGKKAGKAVKDLLTKVQKKMRESTSQNLGGTPQTPEETQEMVDGLNRRMDARAAKQTSTEKTSKKD